MYSWIHVEGARQNSALKRRSSEDVAGARKVKTAAGELLKLGNVELRMRRASQREVRRRTGLQKVVDRELRSKGLGREKASREERERAGEVRAWASGRVAEWGYRGAGRVKVRE